MEIHVPGAIGGPPARHVTSAPPSPLGKLQPTVGKPTPPPSARTRWSHKVKYQIAVLNLGVAQEIPLQINIAGTAIECDGNSSGYVQIATNSPTEAARTFMPGYWATQDQYDRLFVTWPAQSGAVCILNGWSDTPGDELRIG